jgi:hypothetical protein
MPRFQTGAPHRVPSGYDEGVRWAHRLLVGISGVTGAALVAHCNVYDPSLLAPDGSQVDAGNGVGFWSGKGDRGCFSAKAPSPADRPPPQGNKDVGDIYLAIQSMRLGSLNADGQVDPNAWQDLGFDLDGTCTGSDTCEGADSPPSCAPTVPQVPLDGHYCRDNTFGRLEYTAALVPEVAKKYGLSDDAFNCALCVGDYNFVIKVTGYNGQPDDDKVRVDFYPSPGLEKPLPWDCASPDWKNHPCWTSDLPWMVQNDTVVEPHGGPTLSDSKLFDDNAYVKDSYIVVQLPDDTLFWFPGFNALVVAYPLRLHQATVTGKLARGADGVWRITDGTIGGRVKAADAVNGLRLIGFCESDPNYSLVSDFVNKNLDVLADGRKDPNATCDAMSLGLSFVALQATAGVLAPVEQPVECVIRGRAALDGGVP